MNRFGFIQALSVLFMLGLSPVNARADGGVIRLHEVKGPFVVTIFTVSEPLRDTPVDISVMVQGRDSSDAILDADVNLVFTPPAASLAEPTEEICGAPGLAGLGTHTEQFTVAATRRQASNKLLYAAPVKLGAEGDWRLQAFIKHEGDAVEMACILPVSAPPRKLLALFPYLVLPPLMATLFAINQCLRKQSCL